MDNNSGEEILKTLIIAEAGVNHNGDVKLALELCDKAKEVGADIVKFQTWKTKNIITKSAKLAEYQKASSSKIKNQYDLLNTLELSYNDFQIIKDHCDKIGITFLSTPDDFESLEFLLSIGIPFIKVGSGEVTNIPYLREIAKAGKEVILSTGMSYLREVEKAYYTLLDSGAKSVSLLHCTTNYPCPMEEVNLLAMKTLKDAFKTSVGYSDHTLGIEIPIAAVAMGAEIIEKHFTLDKRMVGPDHAASLDPDEFKLMVKSIRNLELALGDGLKRPNKSELEIAKVARKFIVAKKRIKMGETFNEENLALKRTHNLALSAEYWDIIIGQKAKKDFEEDEGIMLL
jgi:N-acetylneuraminate synthase/N,N'-diacetyllegionaminate synthase